MSAAKGSDTVAVFWDYENCPASSNASGYSIVNNICALAHPFGVVKLFKAYLEIPDQSRSITLRSELQSSGVSLVDCPHNGRKEVADKMILVDMLAYAIDNPAPSTIFLITGDRDFAYALSILKHRRYQVVLVTLPNAHASLVHQACVTFDWFNDIVNHLDTSNSQHRHGVQQAQAPDISNEARSSPCNDLTDGEESDYGYPRKQAQRDIYPTYSTGNTQAPRSPSKNSNNRTHSPIPPTSYFRAPEPNVMTFDEYCSRRILPSNKSLIGRIGSGVEHSQSPSPSNSEPSSPSASPRIEDDRRLERYRPYVIPNIYTSLVKILQGHRRKRIMHSYRSVIAGKIPIEHTMYCRVGITTFAELLDRAERDGIVELGGGRDAEWVRLLPDWADAVPY